MAESSAQEHLRVTKRKLEDAFQILDSAVISNEREIDGPSPPKRANTFRSFYSTLAKYGVKSKETDTAIPASVTKSTPHLSAILSRAASRTKNTFSFHFGDKPENKAPLLPPTADYRPSSLSSFLSRIETFKLSTYTNKPASLDAVAAAKCGWINDGKDRLVCGLCNASWVVAGREGLTRDAANSLIERQRVALVESHKAGCPWRTRQCDPSIYCIPLKAPSNMASEVKVNALTIDTFMNNVSIQHPLSQSQVNSLRTIIESCHGKTSTAESSESMEVDERQPSDPAILASLFGWRLVTPAHSLQQSISTPSFSRSRASSISRSASPAPSHSPLSHSSPLSAPVKFRVPANLATKPENALFQCELCQRRIGLWAFINKDTETAPAAPSTEPPTPTGSQEPTGDKPSTPSRPTKTLPRRSFDLLREHRSYCPYVVRSTVVPSLPTPQGVIPTSTSSSLVSANGSNSNAVEGWKAVLTVVLRYGMAQRQRLEYTRQQAGIVSEDGSQGTMEQDTHNVHAMIEGVKTRGGKDLLKYVRNLLA